MGRPRKLPRQVDHSKRGLGVSEDLSGGQPAQAIMVFLLAVFCQDSLPMTGLPSGEAYDCMAKRTSESGVTSGPGA